MLLAYLIYICSLLLMLSSAWANKHYVFSQGRNKGMLYVSTFIICIVSFILCMRYEVGTDWENYKYIFESYSVRGLTFVEAISKENIEPLYSALNYIVVKLGGSYQLLLFIIMAAHLGLLMTLCRSFPRYSMLIVFFYFMVLFLTTLNIHRQTLAICIFLVSLVCLQKNQNIRYILGAIIAILFHYSSIIILLVPLLKSRLCRFLDNRYVSIGLYVAGFFIGQFLMDAIITYLPLMTDNSKYNSTLENLEHVHEFSSGLGMMFYKLLDIILIWNIPKFINRGMYLYSRTFVVGTVIANAFANSMFLARVAFPFTSIKILLLPMLLQEYLAHKKLTLKRFAAIIAIAFALLGFMMNISNHNAGCSPFQFI